MYFPFFLGSSEDRLQILTAADPMLLLSLNLFEWDVLTKEFFFGRFLCSAVVAGSEDPAVVSAVFGAICLKNADFSKTVGRNADFFDFAG
jgi:hypothetical protein